MLPASARAPCPRPSTHQSCRARPCSATPRGPTRPCKAVETVSLGRYVRTTQTNAAAIRLHLVCISETQSSPGQACRPLWSGEWLKRAAAASKCLGKTLVAHFDHAVRDRVVEADLPEALLRDSAVREHARSATRSSAGRLGPIGCILGSKGSRLPVSLAAASWPWRRHGGGSGHGGTAAPCQGRARRLPRRRSRRSTRRSPIGRKQEGSAKDQPCLFPWPAGASPTSDRTPG